MQLGFRARWQRSGACFDVLLIVLAILFAGCSLSYPFGHDQGVHFYVAREWLRHGAMPYRDAFDYKPIGIFALHAIAITIFGERIWGIRALEIVEIVGLGFACWLLLPKKQARSTLGICVLGASVGYFGFLSFWDTAQCELGCAVLAVLGIALAQRRLTTASGLAFGAAAVMKTPGIAFAVLGAFVLVRATRRRSALVPFFAAMALPPAAMAAWLHHHGAWVDTVDVLGNATLAYVVDGRRANGAGSVFAQSCAVLKVWSIFLWPGALGSVALAGRCLWERSFSSLRALSMPAWLAVAGYIAFVVQMKFYIYHAVLLLPALVLALGVAASAWRSYPRLLTFAGLAFVFAVSGRPARSWARATETTASLALGWTDERVAARFFTAPGFRYDWAIAEDVGDWLRLHTTPDELVLVRGFDAEIYAVADRSAPGRFFWTVPFTDPFRQYRRAAWTAEDLRAIQARPPAFVVASLEIHSGPDSAEYFAPLGYVDATHIGRFAILQRGTVASNAGRE